MIKKIDNLRKFRSEKKAQTWAEKCQRALNREQPLQWITIYPKGKEFIVEIYHFVDKD